VAIVPGGNLHDHFFCGSTIATVSQVRVGEQVMRGRMGGICKKDG